MKGWLTLALLLITSLAIPGNSLAGVSWCKSDPVILLNGTILDVTVEIPLEYVHLVNGPVRYTIQTPVSVDRQVIIKDLGYNGYGSTVTFTNRSGGISGSRFLTTFSASVPIDTSRLAPGEEVPARITVLSLESGLVVTAGTSVVSTTTLWVTGFLNGNPNPLNQIIGTGDFNGDGKQDILWQHTVTGATTVWLMNGTRRTSSASPGTLSPLTWQASGTGDFNGDKKADILWRNTLTGAAQIWVMNGTQRSSVGNPGTVALAWQAVGTGDFNGDKKADILWRNNLTGATNVWLMNGTTRASSGSPGTVSDLGWAVDGVGDFNGDSKQDVLWRHTITGATTVWLMNGTTRASSGSPGTVAALAWQVVGTGDFNGDKKADIFWRNNLTGATTIWLMNGVRRTTLGSPGTLADLAWEAAGTGDFNGDGKDDILWRNRITGLPYVSLMNGTYRNSGSPGTLIDLNVQPSLLISTLGHALALPDRE